jgi:hypothetical protein
VDRGIISFLSFIEWVEQLPYQRNSDRADYTLVFTEECGACSTKNALVAALALENKWSDVQLFLGIYLMSDKTNPGVGAILSTYGLAEIPEAHTYLKINGEIRDVTGLPAGAEPFVKTLFDEIPIEPHQIGDFKLDWHTEHLARFASSQNRSLMEVKKIREACIAKLSE